MDTVATELSSVVAQISASDAQRVRAMAEGGAKLHRVKTQLAAACTAGTPFEKLEALAQQLIAAEGATPNFVLVPKYHWATCIMRNDEMCHGIPRGKTVGKGDVVKIDVGLLWQGYNLDTTVTVCVDRVTDAQRAFVDAARAALEKAIVHATANSSVFDVSSAMQKYMERRGYGMVFQLTGHGIGRGLHEEPSIPCVAQRRDKREMLRLGQTIAVEVMAAMGDAELVLDADGWTYRTKDGSWTAMVEETVVVGERGGVVLT